MNPHAEKRRVGVCVGAVKEFCSSSMSGQNKQRGLRLGDVKSPVTIELRRGCNLTPHI